MLCVLGWWVLNEFANPCSGHSLDEQQFQVRNQTFFRAYQVVAALIALGLIYCQFALEPRRTLILPSTDSHMQPVVWGFFLLAITLPQALIAWQDPDYEAPSPVWPDD